MTADPRGWTGPGAGTGNPTGVLRWSRAALLATVALAAGAVGHVAADGLLPGAAGLTAVWLVALLGAAALLGRPASTLRVVALLVGGQAVVHGLLSVLAGHAGPAGAPAAALAATRPAGTPAASADRTGSFRELAHGAEPLVAASGSGAGPVAHPVDHTVDHPLTHLVEHLTGQPPLMVLAHLAAAALAGLWLAAGERALVTILALLAAPALRGLDLPALVAAALAVGAGAAAAHRSARVIRGGRRSGVPPQCVATGTLARRGPPALLAV